jgi:hypothetical protein
MGRHYQLRGIVAKPKTKWKGMPFIEKDCLKITELLQQRWKENSIFISKNVSTKTVWQDFHKPNIQCRGAIAKPLITFNAKRHRLYDDHKTRMSNDWTNVIWSDKLSFTLFPTSGCVYVWKTPKEAYNLECRVPTVKHGSGSIMIWAALSWYSAGPTITLNG